MANGIIQYALGKDLTITITAQVVAADGTLSDHSDGSFIMNGRVDSVESSVQLQTENLSPMHSFMANPVPYELSGSYSIMEYVEALPLVTSANKGFGYGNVLQYLSKVSFYFKIKLDLYDHTAAGAVMRDSELIYALMTTPVHRSTAKNKTMDSREFQLVSVINTSTGAYLANPSYPALS
jgi:hypothetical protein